MQSTQGAGSVFNKHGIMPYSSNTEIEQELISDRPSMNIHYGFFWKNRKTGKPESVYRGNTKIGRRSELIQSR
jgi:hypothetical protein